MKHESTQHPPGLPPFFLVVKKKREWCQKGCLNQLKIEQWVAYRLIIIATRAFRAPQNSYGFRAIWSWVTNLVDFQKRRISKVICVQAKLTFEVSKRRIYKVIWFWGKFDLWFLISQIPNGPTIFIFYKIVGL